MATDIPLEKIIGHVVRYRQIICPRTSYVTAGSAASVLYCLNGSDSITKLVMDTGEFIDVRLWKLEDVPEMTSTLQGNIILAFDVDHSVIQDLAKAVDDNKSDLAVFVMSGAQVCPLDSTISDISTEQIDQCNLLIVSKPLFSRRKREICEDRGNNNQPTVQSRGQFKFLWESPDCRDGKARVLQRLHSNNSGISSHRSMSDWNDVISAALSEGKDDFDIYSFLRKLCLGTSLEDDLKITAVIQQTLSEKKTSFDGRSNYMVTNLLDCIPYRLRGNIKRLFDYGCAEGDITANIGEQLGLSPENCIGADVRMIPANNFTFIQLPSENDSAYDGMFLSQIDDGSIDLITASMVFHHVRRLETTLSELRRIISNQGALVIREHNCVTPSDGAFLDITHGLYSLVWSSPVSFEI